MWSNKCCCCLLWRRQEYEFSQLIFVANIALLLNDTICSFYRNRKIILNKTVFFMVYEASETQCLYIFISMIYHFRNDNLKIYSENKRKIKLILLHFVFFCSSLCVYFTKDKKGTQHDLKIEINVFSSENTNMYINSWRW